MSNTIRLRCHYCVSIAGLLKWLQLALNAVVIGLICWESTHDGTIIFDLDNLDIHKGEYYTLLTVCIGIVTTFTLLLIAFLNCHRLPKTFRCGLAIRLIFLALMVLHISAGVVETWATLDFKKRRKEVEFGRRAAASGICFMNGLLYLVSYIVALLDDV